MSKNSEYLEYARSIEDKLERDEKISSSEILTLIENTYHLEQTSNIDQTFRKLVDWNNGHKARSVDIECPTGYGAGCWTVTLGHERGVTRASEVSFWTLPEDEGGDKAYRENAAALGAVFANVNEDGTEYEYGTWPGLRDTVEAALKAVENGIYKKESPKLMIEV